MVAIETLKRDVQEGRIDSKRLVDLVVAQQRQIQTQQQQIQSQQQELQAANQRVVELEKKLGVSPTAKVAESYSLHAEEKRQEARGKKKPKDKQKKGRPGRRKSQDKIALAARTEPIYPQV